MYFCPLVALTSGGFRPKLPQFTTTKPPELHNSMSWGPVCKMTGQLGNPESSYSQSPTPLYDPDKSE